MKKVLFTLMMVAVLACPAMAQRYRGFQLYIVDEFGDAVTNIDTIEIQDAGTSTTSTIYSTRAGTARTNPMTTTSGGFTQSLGLVQWFQRAASFKVVVTESGASQSLTRDNLDSTNTRIAWFVDYIGEAATLQTTDDANLDIGTGDDFTHDWDNTNSRYIIHASSDASGTLHFGKAALHNDIYWHTGAAITSDHVLFDEGNAVVDFIDVDLMIDDEGILYLGTGDDVSFDYDSSGDDLDILSAGDLDLISWGATSAGYDQEWWTTSAGDKILLDVSENELYLTDVDIMWDDDADAIFGSDEDFVIDSDTAKTLDILPGAATDDYMVNFGLDQSGVDIKAFGTTSGDYMGWDASADLFTIVGDEADITLSGTGTDSFDLNLAGGFDIDIAGAATEDFNLTNTGGSIVLSASEAVTDAVNIDATGVGGGIDIDTTAGAITLTAASTTGGDITISAGDILTVTHVDKIIFDGAAAETWEIEGTANGYEATVVFTDPTADATITIPATGGGTILIPSYTAFTASGNIDATLCYGGVFTNTGASGDIELEMPSAVAGMEFTVFVSVACDVDLDPDASDKILSVGMANGISISCNKVVGTYITLYAIDASNWIIKSASGAWVNGGA